MDRGVAGGDRLGSRLGVTRERRRAGDGARARDGRRGRRGGIRGIRRPSRAVVRDRRPGRGRRARPSPNRPPSERRPLSARRSERLWRAAGHDRAGRAARAGSIASGTAPGATIVTRGIARSPAGDRSRPGDRPRARGPERRRTSRPPGSLSRIDKQSGNGRRRKAEGDGRARAERGTHLIGGARSTRRV